MHDLLERLAGGHAAGVTVVTPNRRLAQTVQRDFDAHQVAQGRSVWDTADVLPFGSFVERLWDDVVYGGHADPLTLLTPAQEQALWEEIVKDSRLSETLLCAGAAARHCREAWQLAQAWRLTPKLSHMIFNEDTAAFMEWSSRYESLTRERQQIDSARLPDAVMAHLADRDVRKPKVLVMYAFDTLTPQQQALTAALGAQAVSLSTVHPEPRGGCARRLEFNSVREEISTVAAWARERLEDKGERTRIGIVIPDLKEARSHLLRTLAATLTPAALLPSADPSAPLPFDLSLGLPLNDYPLVRDALLGLQLAGLEMTFQDVSRLVGSPYLGAAVAEAPLRAGLDACLREHTGVVLTLAELVTLLALRDMPRAPLLTQRLERLAGLDLRTSRTPPQWAQAFSSILSTLGFPGEHTLDSHEYQTLEKWHGVLTTFAALERVSGKMGYAQALQGLRSIAADTLFQPEAPAVPIAVLGVLESAGLTFDHLWVMGLTDEAWPLAPRPNPLIPLALQRAAGIPYADAAASLERGRRMTQAWLAAAPEVILSFSGRLDDREMRMSPLISSVERVSLARLGTRSFDSLRDLIHRAGALEQIEDGAGPALEAVGPTPGGTALFKDQAACPFRAFARHRLDSKPLITPEAGLNAAERGILVHQMLAAVWASLRSQARLDSIEPAALTHLLQVGAAGAIAAVQRRRPGVFKASVAVLEQARLVKMTREWLELERMRPAFEVIAIERKQPVSFGGLTVNAKLDRMDALASPGEGGRAVIDYKTGESSVSAWLGPRPDEPQLLLYALGETEPVTAVAFAQLKTGDLRFKGLGFADGALPGVSSIAQCRSPLARQYADWAAMLRAWRAELDSLGRGFVAGDARVDPKYGEYTCAQCDQQILCRVAEKRS